MNGCKNTQREVSPEGTVTCPLLRIKTFLSKDLNTREFLPRIPKRILSLQLSPIPLSWKGSETCVGSSYTSLLLFIPTDSEVEVTFVRAVDSKH